MHHFFVDTVSPEGIRIEGQDARHILKVLRLSAGDMIEVSCGENSYLCEITGFTEDTVETKIRDMMSDARELPAGITLYQGLPKKDKMELILQKAVELGAARIVPVAMHRSVVQLTGDKAAKRLERYQGIAEAAAKQSRRDKIPEVGPLMTMKEALADAEQMDRILLPYENAEGMDYARKVLQQLAEDARGGMVKEIGIFIGPEGGFEASEVEALTAQGAEIISLGHRILRTETAGMAVLAILGFLMDAD